MVVTSIPFSVLRDAMKESRRPRWDIPVGAERGEGNSAFHVSDGMGLNIDHIAVKIRGGPPDESRLYSIACDTRAFTYVQRSPVKLDASSN